MAVSDKGKPKCLRSRKAPASARGFTLLELLVVVVIAGITLGMVSFTAFQNNGKAVQQEAQRIALLLQLGREEAILRNRPVAFEADSEHYWFMVRNEDGSGWNNLNDDEMLHERAFKKTPMLLTITPSQDNVTTADNGQVRFVFGREPVDKPFLMTLSIGDNDTTSAVIHGDGIGHFTVE
ncbi:GspH/FimT family pseudopilin [Glaciimonas soli]|uniref:GspH/FimT family pseudopilin n=1 Tax=Glaciimonas soli TaxID=2590999 RepID=UPI002AD54187|nr:GspH/FimT family protein [Glaciimonas soli]